MRVNSDAKSHRCVGSAHTTLQAIRLFTRSRAFTLRKCVCDDSELSHDGGKRDFWRLSGCDEGLIFFFHCGIESDGDEGGHIEGLPQVSPATADKAVFFAVRAGTLRR